MLLPDRRNLFAYPLGPGFNSNTFQHAAGEIIFNLPNGLQGYLLVNANDVRQNKGNNAIVSDPKRPDRAVEAGVSCMSCHAGGINPKDDQIRDFAAKNAKSFSRKDADLIRALHVLKEKMRARMDEDCERFRKALAKTGNKVSVSEPIMNATLRYEADVDLPTLAAEVGLKPQNFLRRLRSPFLAKSFGALQVPGGTVPRNWARRPSAISVRDLHLGAVIQPGQVGEALPDNTGEVDPLEAESSPANAAAFSPDGLFAAFASADKSVVIWDVDAGLEKRRCIGHTASVWCVAFLSRRIAHSFRRQRWNRSLVGDADGPRTSCFSRSRRFSDLRGFFAGRPARLSAGYDNKVIIWDLERNEAAPNFAFSAPVKYINAVAFSPDGERCLVCAERTVYIADANTGKVLQTFTGHTDSVATAVFSPDGKRVLSGGDDRTMRLWDAATGKQILVFSGHEGGVKSVAFSPDCKHVLSGATDATVRWWDEATGKELRVFRKHTEPIVALEFVDDGRATLSVSRDGNVRLWAWRSESSHPNEKRNRDDIVELA